VDHRRNLHFEIRTGPGSDIDPLPYLRRHDAAP
jgi:hypothetical protein